MYILIGVVVVIIVAFAFGVRYFRTSAIFIETADMNSDFIEGVEEACDALNVRLIRDDRDPDCASATIITTQSIECGDKLVTYGPTAQGGVLHVDVNKGDLLQKAIDVAYQKKAGRIAVVRFEDDDAADTGNVVINIKTTRERVLEDVFRTIQTRVIDAFVIMDPSLMFDRRKIVNSKLIIACGFEDKGADVTVYYDSKEQGYMAAVLAYNMSKGRKLFRSSEKIKTKIYTTGT
jgi:hypothetical protein